MKRLDTRCRNLPSWPVQERLGWSSEMELWHRRRLEDQGQTHPKSDSDPSLELTYVAIARFVDPPQHDNQSVDHHNLSLWVQKTLRMFQDRVIDDSWGGKDHSKRQTSLSRFVAWMNIVSILKVNHQTWIWILLTKRMTRYFMLDSILGTRWWISMMAFVSCSDVANA